MYNDILTINNPFINLEIKHGLLHQSLLKIIIFRRLSAIMFYVHFLNFISVIYRWNRNEVFYLLSSSDDAYLDCVGIYKAFNFAASPKIEC